MPEQIFTNVAGIHIFSAPDLRNLETWTKSNVPGAQNDNSPIRYDALDPKSLGEVLRIHYETSGYPAFNANRPWHSNVLDLSNDNSPLYIVSPDIYRFNSSQGPRGEHIILRRVGATAAFGETIRNNLTNDLDYFTVAGETLKTIRFRLVNGNGAEVPLHGAEWSFSIIFQPLEE